MYDNSLVSSVGHQDPYESSSGFAHPLYTVSPVDPCFQGNTQGVFGVLWLLSYSVVTHCPALLIEAPTKLLIFCGRLPRAFMQSGTGLESRLITSTVSKRAWFWSNPPTTRMKLSLSVANGTNKTEIHCWYTILYEVPIFLSPSFHFYLERLLCIVEHSQLHKNWYS